jgi:hypothetical protein
MKKLFYLFAAATLFVGVVSCKAKEEAAEEATEEVVTEEVAAEETAPVDSTTAAPADSATTVAE